MEKGPTYNEWIVFEEGCEMPENWEAVIVPARTKTKLVLAIYIDKEFHILGQGRESIIIPKMFMRIDTSKINREKDSYVYKK